jgi:hypothetical protein
MMACIGAGPPRTGCDAILTCQCWTPFRET